MVTLWYSKVKNNFNGTILADVPERYYADVLARLVADGLYNVDGTKVNP